MKKNKLAIISVGAMASLFLLSGCGSSGDTNLVTMKDGKITQEEYYNKIKAQPNNEQILQQMIITKIADDQYGDKVSSKEIDKTFNEMKKTYGDQFDAILKANGYTQKSYKEELRSTLAIQEMLKSNIKVTDKDLEKAFKDFHPEVEAQIIEVTDENKAKDLQQQAKNDANQFGKLAKENSVDESAKDEGKVKFGSQSKTIPAQVQKVAWDMKDGDISDVITVEQTNPQTFQTVKSYYIVKMDKQSTKDNDYKKYKKQLKQIVIDEKLNDPNTVRKIIKKELKDQNVQITDKQLKNVLASFTTDPNAANKDKK